MPPRLSSLDNNSTLLPQLYPIFQLFSTGEVFEAVYCTAHHLGELFREHKEEIFLKKENGGDEDSRGERGTFLFSRGMIKTSTSYL